MSPITKCLNEWNATVEALGQGKQTILIRNYRTTLERFVLYPTLSYTNKDDYLDSFQEKYQSFIQQNSLPKEDGKKKQVRYVAKVDKILEKPVSRINTMRKYYLWTNEHVRSYLNSQKAYVWVLRVYKLKEPVMAERTKGIRYANLTEPLSLKGIKPVLSDTKFSKILEDIV